MVLRNFLSTYCKKDFDIIVSLAKLKSINPVIINLDTIPKQKFPIEWKRAIRL